MTSSSQFLNSSAPVGSLTTQFSLSTPALVKSNGDYYIRTGEILGNIPPDTIAEIASKNADYLAPIGKSSQLIGTAKQKNTSLTYGNGTYVRSSNNGLIYSTDGISWGLADLTGGAYYLSNYTEAVPLSNVVFGNGVFITIMKTDSQNGGTGRVSSGRFNIASSTDGINWTQNRGQIAIGSTSYVSDNTDITYATLSFDGTTFFLCATIYSNSYGGYNHFILSSTNGLTWKTSNVNGSINPASSTSSYPYIVVKSTGSLWVAFPSYNTSATPSYYTSVDGYTWTSRTNTLTNTYGAQSLKFLSGLFVLVTGLNSTTQALYTSTDGITWTGRTTVNGTLSVSCYLYDIAYGAGLYVAVGLGGTVNTSIDGITWTLRTAGLTSADTFVSIEYDATLSRFIALTSRTTTGKGIKVSTDGITWADPTVGSYYGGNSYGNPDNTTSKLLAKLNGKWFACAGAGGENLISSTDGLTWTTVLNASNTFNFTYNASASIKRGANYNTLFKLNDSMFALTSCGGIIGAPLSTERWSQRIASTTSYSSMAYGMGLYVTVGAGGVIVTSPDGFTWTSRTSGTSTALTSIAFSGNEFIAMGSSVMLRSTDAITWTNVSATGALQGASGSDNYPTYGYLCYSAGCFHTMYGSYWFRSPNGLPGTWETIALGANPSSMIPTSYGVAFSSTNNISATAGYSSGTTLIYGGGGMSTSIYLSVFEIAGVTVAYGNNNYPNGFTNQYTAVLFNKIDSKNISNPRFDTKLTWIGKYFDELWSTGSAIYQYGSYGGEPIVSASGNSVVIVDSNRPNSMGFMQGQGAIYFTDTTGVSPALYNCSAIVDTGISVWSCNAGATGALAKTTKGVCAYMSRVNPSYTGASGARIGPLTDANTISFAPGGTANNSYLHSQTNSYIKIT